MVSFSQQTATPAAVSPASKSTRSTDQKFLPLVVVAAVILVVGGVYYFFFRGRGTKIASGEYHAVFLTNNQVYFGRIAKSNDREVVLKDVYYLLIRQPAQVQGQSPETTPGAQPQGPKFELRHLGDREPHGPVDEMRINRDQILFIEPLREDGMVVRGIQRYKEQQQQQ